jgi:hypothetical protein
LYLELIDLKVLFFDVDGMVRSLGGVKKSFNVNDLPSEKHKRTVQIEHIRETETKEERLKRQKAFFESLKALSKNK